MSHMRRPGRLLALAALLAGSAACGDVVREGRSPAFLVINSLAAAPGNNPQNLSANLDSDVVTNVTQPPPCSSTAPCARVFGDVGAAVLSLAMKNISVEPTTNNQVTIRRYRVDYMRTDGRNVAGVDVPYGFDGATTVTVSPGATATVGFDLVRNAAKLEAPLVQLSTGANVLDTIATVTFYGTDQVGNAVSVSGTIRVSFANFGDSSS